MKNPLIFDLKVLDVVTLQDGSVDLVMDVRYGYAVQSPSSGRVSPVVRLRPAVGLYGRDDVGVAEIKDVHKSDPETIQALFLAHVAGDVGVEEFQRRLKQVAARSRYNMSL